VLGLSWIMTFDAMSPVRISVTVWVCWDIRKGAGIILDNDV